MVCRGKVETFGDAVILAGLMTLTPIYQSQFVKNSSVSRRVLRADGSVPCQRTELLIITKNVCLDQDRCAGAHPQS